MRKHWLAFGLVIAIAALMMGTVACSSSKKSSNATPTTSSAQTPTAGAQTPTGGNAQSEVTVTLVEYQMKPNVTSVPAGSVTFNGKNIGGAEHSLAVIRTDLAPEALPTKADGSVDESGTGVTLVDQVTGIKPQQQKSLTVKLQPGNYVLICNLVPTANGQTISHYAKGMHVGFTITQ
jgi:uncharacterized cupredoxin-like copper-binding protein